MFKRNVFCSLYARASTPRCGVYIFKHTVWYFMTKFTNTFRWRQQTVVALFAYYFRQESLLQVGVSTVQKIKLIVYNQQHVKCGYWTSLKESENSLPPPPQPPGFVKECTRVAVCSICLIAPNCWTTWLQILTAFIFVGFKVCYLGKGYILLS